MGTAIGIGVSPSLTSMLGAGSDPILPSGLWLDADTWTHTGVRKSIGPDLDLGVNEGDVFCMDGRDVNGIVDAAALIDTNDLSTWNKTAITVADEGSGVYSMTEDTATNVHRLRTITVGAVGVVTFVAEVKKTGAYDEIQFGSVIASSTVRFDLVTGLFTNVSAGIIANGAIDMGDDYWRIYWTVDYNGASARANIFGYNSGTNYTGNGIENYRVRNMSFSLGNKVPPSFPFESALGTSCGADLATVTTPAWPATGRTLTVSRRNYATGVISSVSTTPAPTAGRPM